MKKRKEVLATNLCGKRIKIARVAQEMKQIDVAAAMNVDYGIDITQNGVSYIERNRRFVKDFELVAIAEILEVNPLWLLFGDKQPKFKDKPMKMGN
jgi:transcriptional regulator with XRE-family HTH domain